MQMIIFVLLIAGSWFLHAHFVHYDFDHYRLFNFRTLYSGLFAGVVSIISFLIDWSRYHGWKKWTAFIPSIFVLLCAGAFFLMKYRLKRTDASPVVLRAERATGGWNSMSLEFREDQTYKWSNHQFPNSDVIRRGYYTVTDSNWKLVTPLLLPEGSCGNFVLRTVANDSTHLHKPSLLKSLIGTDNIATPDHIQWLIPLDNNGHPMNNGKPFRIRME